ncbi:MAG: right-handed parallel beta-helix repeat-containing protein [Aquabacterium sp.]|nr:right-handed parallel beta-helix repeat-containing protein [Aquabacterium sp.]
MTTNFMTRRRLLGAGLCGALVAPACAAGDAAPPSRPALRVGAGQPFARLADALRQAVDGDTIEVLPGTYAGDVAVINQRRLTLRGMGERPVLLADGKYAEGKAILVVRNGHIVIENFEFRGTRVPDRNGAGIRFEKGMLTVRNCQFIDNENGILTANFGDARLHIEDSLFAQAPDRPDSLDHLIYVGRIAEVQISGSRFHQGRTGNLIKSRARVSRITYNLIADGPKGEASYEIDLPNGGQAVVIGNVIAQSANSQNAILVSFGAEGQPWPGSALYMAHNTLVNDRLRGAWFLRVWRDRLPDGTPVHLYNNLSVGPGLFTLGVLGGPTEEGGNFAILKPQLVDPDQLNHALPPDSGLRGKAVPLPILDGVDLRPTAEFTLPIGTRPLAPRERWSPGAFQR